MNVINQVDLRETPKEILGRGIVYGLVSAAR